MNKSFLVLLLLFSFSFSTYSQSFNERESPYRMNWIVDGSVVGATLGLNAFGFMLIQSKNPLTEQELASLSKEDIPAIDRWAAGNYSEDADALSDYPFYSSFTIPFLMILTDDMRPHAGQISVLFLESMATTGALYTISAGSIDRVRPLSYNENIPDELRMESGATRSFFGGHTAATATATFFAAKIYNDFYPESAARPYIWTAAALVPAWVAYLRTTAGKHFLTDNLVGYGVGALSGILIPELHKKENPDLSIFPTFGSEYKGMAVMYRF